MRIVEEFVIPARYGRAFLVKRGQVLRMFPMEDGQVADCVFYNAHDTREWFHCGETWAVNSILRSGTAKSFKYFYSKPPRENLMFTMLEDTYPNHFGNMGGRCSPRLLELRNRPDYPPDDPNHTARTESGHRSCQQNLEEAVAAYGLAPDDVMDVFNLFMNVDFHPDGSYTIKPSTVTRKDYLDLRAEMDILAAVSACPADNNPVNNWRCSPIGVRIYAG